MFSMLCTKNTLSAEEKQDVYRFSEVYHVQRRARLDGTLLLRQGCTVLQEHVQFEGCENPVTIYTPVSCLGSVEQLFLFTPLFSRNRALYTVQQGDQLLVYTPYRRAATLFGEQALLPLYSCDQEAMFQAASERSQLADLDTAPEASSEETIKLPRILARCGRGGDRYPLARGSGEPERLLALME